ncbi:hypothetical protein ACIOYV_08125 [Pseudomonas sp. NPDC087342]|uniref:YncE family protein n=1 Tax=Pseudomonas sp. NPDC087342 TaxID=3364437 RepID=UPI00381E2BE8
MTKFPAVESEASSAPLALRPPYFPSSTTLADPRRYTGGIPIRALEGNLQCIIPPWTVMGIGDQVDVTWQSLTSPAVSKTIEFDHEVDKQVVLWIPRGQVLEGDAEPVFYRVTRRGQTPEPSVPLETYLVKTTRPGGYDDSPEEGHSGFKYSFLTDTSGGVDADIANRGVQMRIEPYQHMTAYDRIVCRWGSQEVMHYPVTQAQVNDPVNNPIIITFTRAVIEAAGDGPRVVVTFQVIDCVDNRPDERAPWAKLSYVLVDLGGNRLDAPLVLVAGRPTNSIDLDQLGDDDVNVRVYTPVADFAVGDTVRLTWTGTPAQGSPIIVGPLVKLVDFVPFQLDFTIPNAAVKAIAQGYATASYVRIRSGEADRPSKNASVSVRGAIDRLAAPSVAQAPGGTLPADAPYATISVPYFEGRKTGDLITIHCQGRRPGGSETYYPIPIIVADSDGRSAITRDLPGSEIAPLGGGTLKLYYVVANDDLTVRSERESLPLNLNVGVALPDFNRAEITEADGDVLLPEKTPNGANVIAPFNVPGDTLPGDTVGLRWTGSVTGAHPLYEIPLTTQTAGKPVPFLVSAEHIHPNVNGTVEVDYYRKRGTEATRFSRKRVLSVGNALPDWAAPTIKEAPNGVSLNPVAAKDTLTAIVDYDMRVGDKITVTWTGASGVGTGGSHTTAAFNVENLGPKEISLPNSVVAFNLNKPVVVTYSVTRGSEQPVPSLPLILNVGTLPASELNSPIFIQADENDVLDVSNLAGSNATIHGLLWPLIAAGQHVWMSLHGKNADGTDYISARWSGDGSQVNSIWINQGYWPHNIGKSQLMALADNSRLTIKFKVAMDKSNIEDNATVFPDRVYTVLTTALIDPTITSVKGASSGADIPDNASTFETSLKFSGKATANKKIELRDNGIAINTIDVDESGDWEDTVANQTPGNHSYTVKAVDGTLPESDARTLRIIHYTVEVIRGVAGVSGLIVNKDSTRLYAISSHAMYIFDTTTNTLINTITLSGSITKFAVSPNDRKAYIINVNNEPLYIGIIDIATNTETKRIPAPGLRNFIVFSPDGTRAYAGSSKGIYVIDTTREEIIATIADGSGPSSLAITPDGIRLCCTYSLDGGSQELVVINTSNNQITRIDLPRGRWWRAAATNTHGYVLDMTDGNIAVFDFSSSTIVASIQYGNAGSIAASPNGSFIYISTNFDRNLTTIETATYSIANNITQELRIDTLATAPDNSHIYASHRGGEDAISVFTLS